MNGIKKLKFSPSIDINVLKNATLILPAISVGNIGQLAIDILLASTKAKKLTACYHPSLIPLVGSNPIDANSSELMTACELYKTSIAQCNEKIVLMQIRSAIVRNKSGEFLDDLLSWCNSVGIQNGNYTIKINDFMLYAATIIPNMLPCQFIFISNLSDTSREHIS